MPQIALAYGDRAFEKSSVKVGAEVIEINFLSTRTSANGTCIRRPLLHSLIRFSLITAIEIKKEFILYNITGSDRSSK